MPQLAETAVRNDTGVYEGGEISHVLRPNDRQALHLGADPRGQAIDARCATALDSFDS